MAKLSVNGLDDLMLSLEEIAAIPDDVARAMVRAEADVIIKAQKEMAAQMKVDDTGLTIESIDRGPVRRKNGTTTLYITPKGTRIRGKNKLQEVRNAEIAFVNEYGKRGQPARPFIATANEKAADLAVAEAEKIYDEFLKSKNL